MKLPSALFFLIAACHAQADDPAAPFAQNCAACHMLDQAIVGPSLVEIRSLYLNKPDDFVKWCLDPQKKRPDAIQMPAMAHLDKQTLLGIHAYVMATADGVTERQPTPPATVADITQRPAIQRIFMPNASPAAIAVALDDDVSFCWDAGPCRLRYIWTGGFIDGTPYWEGNGNGLAEIKGTLVYNESSSLFSPETKVKFHGYELRGGYPVFAYSLGSQQITEAFTPLAGKKGLARHFTLSESPNAPVVLKFPETTPGTITSSAGTWNDTTLTLTPAEALDFSLTYLFP